MCLLDKMNLLINRHNFITMHNKGLTMVSEPGSKGKKHSTTTTTTTTYNHSIELLKLIFQTICRQVLGLVTLVSYYNYHQNITYPDEPPFWVRIGGLPFTGLSSTLRFCSSRKILGFLY